MEVANNGKFHCFPGFFAQAVGEQFDLFRQYDYRGAFHCGYGQDVEAYLAYRLMDDPALNVNTLLDEYFTRLYGPAAEPMRRFYQTVEQAYADPARIKCAADVVSGDYWQLLFASQPGAPVQYLLVNTAGKLLLDGQPFDASVALEMSPEACAVSLALPFEQVGAVPGGHIHLNVVRRSGLSNDQPMWSPSFGAFDDPAVLRKLVLDTPDTIPTNLPTGVEFERLDARGRREQAGGHNHPGYPRAAAVRLAGVIRPFQWLRPGRECV